MACATEILERLGGGERVRVRVREGLGGEAVQLPRYRGELGEWFFHEVVLFEGRVFDAFGPRQGVGVDEWIDLWEQVEPGDIDFGGLLG